MNKAILIGRLTADPELQTTSSGVDVCRFSLAINRPFKSQNGETQADFLNIVVWRAAAQNCYKYLKKGSQCAVVGSIQTRSYEDNNGVKRYVTEIVAENVEFLGEQTHHLTTMNTVHLFHNQKLQNQQSTNSNQSKTTNCHFNF
ncbi:MAG: single-stranded DNA-binding protein [Clostridia bacterium]|nr:single-stranded DNA-binding protein [Clostridia bacterium]